MAVKRVIPYPYGTFFITFTCYQWLPLIDSVNGYDLVYNWFDCLKSNGHFIYGYVIMPNHVHALIGFRETDQEINSIVGNGKRFIAYDIIKRLKEQNEQALLSVLSSNVEESRKEKNKLHNAWELSFDWKHCRNIAFSLQKLNYMHCNPCKGKWDLCKGPADYLHSSATFYLSGEQGIYPVTNIMEMQDIDLRRMTGE